MDFAGQHLSGHMHGSNRIPDLNIDYELGLLTSDGGPASVEIGNNQVELPAADFAEAVFATDNRHRALTESVNLRLR